ncbi:MAG: hypothetical protein IKR85_07540 [Clostridia bacterium]|nr:hypothetical protein [Clostridia bacterium]
MKKPITMDRIYRRSIRYRITNAVFALVCAGLLALLVVFADKWLKEYELSRPIYAARDYVSSVLAGDCRDLYASEKETLSALDTEEMYDAYVAGQLASGLRLDETPRKLSEDEYEYTARAESGETLTFSVVRTGSTRHNYPVWSIRNTAAHFAPSNSVSVRAPESSSVYAGEELYPLSSAVTRDLPGPFSGYYPEGESETRECVYDITYSFVCPEISVYDRFDRVQELCDDGGVLTAKYNTDEVLLSQYADACAEAFKTIFGYTIGLEGYEKAKKYLIENSTAAYYIGEYQKWQSAKVGSGAFTNLECREFYELAEDAFCCHISADLNAGFKDRNDTAYAPDYIMFFRITDGKPLVYDFYQV